MNQIPPIQRAHSKAWLYVKWLKWCRHSMCCGMIPSDSKISITKYTVNLIECNVSSTVKREDALKGKIVNEKGLDGHVDSYCIWDSFAAADF